MNARSLYAAQAATRNTRPVLVVFGWPRRKCSESFFVGQDSPPSCPAAFLVALCGRMEFSVVKQPASNQHKDYELAALDTGTRQAPVNTGMLYRLLSPWRCLAYTAIVSISYGLTCAINPPRLFVSRKPPTPESYAAGFAGNAAYPQSGRQKVKML